uniref:codanin-1-like isoform X1 n=1 Tax=Styela clava TaxID=7725 RepID=UPI001939A7C5|nr:codanin-1-like isoform X1 [Styela clava]
MESRRHKDLLTSLLDSKNFFFGVKNLSSEESQCLLDPDFINFFLNFLRESSFIVLNNDCSIANVSEIDTKNGPQFTEVDSRCMPLQEMQKMSTPKVRDDIATPKSFRDLHTSSLNNEQTPKYGRQTSMQQDHSKYSGQRYKTKPLSLSDFLSPEAVHIQSQSSSKKKAHKSRLQKGRRITPVSEEKCDCISSSANSRQFSRNEISFSPHYEMSKTSVFSPHDTKSPINPLYSGASRSISFNIEEEFPKLSDTPKQSINCKPSRRIKPTTVTAGIKSELHVLSSASGVNIKNSDNPFTTAVPITPASGIDLNIERHLLLKMKNRENGSNTELQKKNMRIPIKSMEDISPVKKTTSFPDPTHVFESDRITMLAALHSYFINMLLVPNIITELHFIIDLLTASCCVEKPNSSAPSLCITGSLCNSSDSNIGEHTDSVLNTNVLSTAANCVFFAIQTVQYLVSSGFISILSRSTLSLLVQNYRIQRFLPSLSSQLSNLCEEIEEKEKDFSGDALESQEKLHSLSGVPFEADTDDRSNFPSDKSFHAFRKHRDLFYSILREYEDRRNDPNFNIQNHLAGKIKNLVLQVKSTATYKPFVRLFVSQMLQGANLSEISTQMSNRSFARSSFNDSHTSKGDLLTSLRHGDPEKFRRLQSRFVTASNPSVQGNKAKDPLTEQCRFYEEFILTADSYALNTHLCNELRERINDIEIQQTQQILDDASAETVNFASVSSSLCTMISSIRALGRFLGIVTFQPYDTGDGITPYDSHTFGNIVSALENSSTQNYNLVTVAWVTEYLKSATFSTKSLIPEAEDTIKRLFMIYREHAYCDRKDLTTGDVLICLAISSLFEMSIFQDNFFYTMLKKYPADKYCQKSMKLSSIATQSMEQKGELGSLSFDDCCSDLISFSLIYDWYPSLKEIRSTIISCNSGAEKTNQSQQPPRKIKPNTEKKSEETLAQKKEKQLQLTLEEHFFRGQPSSLKRTVAFVAERCASNCVKHIRSIAMLKICDEAEQLFKQRIAEGNYEFDNYSKVGMTRQVVNEMKSSANVRMHKEANEYCDQAVPQCMKDLASCESADGVLNVATAIARKRAISSVYSWLGTRLDELVSVSVKARLTKVSSNVKKEEPALPPKLQVSMMEETDSILPKIESLSSLLHVMKEYTVKLMFRNSSMCLVSIDPSIPAQISERDILFVLSVACALLGEKHFDSSFISSNVGAEKFDKMQQLITSSLHLKNSLLLSTRELANLFGLSFEQNVDNLVSSSLVPAISDIQLSCS